MTQFSYLMDPEVVVILIYKIPNQNQSKGWRWAFHIHDGKSTSKWSITCEHPCSKNEGKHIHKINATKTQISYKTSHSYSRRLLHPTPTTVQDHQTETKRKQKELTEVMTKFVKIDIYTIFHPKKKEYNFSLAPHVTLSKIDHILGNITSINKSKK